MISIIPYFFCFVLSVTPSNASILVLLLLGVLHLPILSYVLIYFKNKTETYWGTSPKNCS